MRSSTSSDLLHPADLETSVCQETSVELLSNTKYFIIEDSINRNYKSFWSLWWHSYLKSESVLNISFQNNQAVNKAMFQFNTCSTDVERCVGVVQGLHGLVKDGLAGVECSVHPGDHFLQLKSTHLNFLCTLTLKHCTM